MLNLGPYGKTIVSLVTGLIGVMLLIINSEPTHITSQEWGMLVVSIAQSLGVYSVANSSE